MDDKEVGKYWDENAENWTILSRMGYDIYRNYLNSPEFFSFIPEINRLKGLDIGCGEGYNTRLAAKKGAQMDGIDASKIFIAKAIQEELKNPLNIHFKQASALNLPYDDEIFDFIISTMAFMDIPNLNQSLKETNRVLKKGGFFQFSILHPCFSTPVRQWVHNEAGNKIGLMCADYFKEQEGILDEWIFSAAPKELTNTMKKFITPRFHKTLATWLNILIEVGFTLERFNEPRPSETVIKKFPDIADCELVACFLIIRCRK